ncbi:MAG: hypothetical protein ACYC9O_07090 [Candidatus Latescibacterota bacterium]
MNIICGYQVTKTGDTLQNAKALLLREIPLSWSSVDDIASGLLRQTNLDLPLDEPAWHYPSFGRDSLQEKEFTSQSADTR